jgi:rhodopsin domain-containing protein
MVLKFSLAAFYLRIMVKRWQKQAVYAVVGLATIIGLIYFLFAIFQCGVPGKGLPFWEKKLMHLCNDKASTLGFGYTHAILTAGTDISLAVLPIPLIWRAQIPRKEKAIVAGILGVGAM